MDFKRMFTKHKNVKFIYYLINYLYLLIPDSLYSLKRNRILKSIKKYDKSYIQERVNYYNKLNSFTLLHADAPQLKQIKLQKKHKVYFLDTLKYTRLFHPQLKISLIFGDITHVPFIPSITKSRPISNSANNSVLLKLNKVRHFTYTKDKKAFVTKKNMLISRNVVKQENRKQFLKMYFNHPMCNIGQINSDGNPRYTSGYMTIEEQLDYKFILCLEGFDVASNLKWVMSSNSIAVMPKPKYETWFMEGKLIPDYHYIEIKDDYSNLEEKLNYYIERTDKALKIIKHANKYVEQFKNNEREDLISFLVLEKYFHFTGQISSKFEELFNMNNINTIEEFIENIKTNSYVKRRVMD